MLSSKWFIIWHLVWSYFIDVALFVLQNEDSDTRNVSDHSDIVKSGESKFKSLKVKVVFIVITF